MVWRTEKFPDSKAGHPAEREGTTFHSNTTGSLDLGTPLRMKNPGPVGDAAETCGRESIWCILNVLVIMLMISFVTGRLFIGINEKPLPAM